MSIKSFVQHSGWQEMVSLCSLIRLSGVCADRDQPEFLCSRSDSRHLEVHVATAGGWLTRYRPREVRNSIYRYRKIHIDYRSKFLYRFISPISIIYGNTTRERARAPVKKIGSRDSIFGLVNSTYFLKITNHNQYSFNIKYLANLIKKYWTCFRCQKRADFLVCFPPSVRVQVRRPPYWKISASPEATDGWHCRQNIPNL